MIKKLIVIVLVILTLTGCADSWTYEGVTYESYGFINKENVKDSKIEYRIITGNVVWGVILCETLAFPVYFFGFSLYEPIGLKKDKMRDEFWEKLKTNQRDFGWFFRNYVERFNIDREYNTLYQQALGRNLKTIHPDLKQAIINYLGDE